MLVLIICWLAFTLAFQSDILVLKSGKTLPCEEYTVADGRVTIVAKGQKYSIPENLVDWDASQVARKTLTQKQEAESIAQKTQNYPKKPSKKRDPITLTSRDLIVKSNSPTENLGSRDMTEFLGDDMSVYEVGPKLRSAFRTIESHADKMDYPSSVEETRQIIDALRQADLDLEDAKQGLVNQRSALQAALNAKPPAQQRTKMINIYNCTNKIDQFADQLSAYNRILIPAIQAKDDSFETLEQLVRQSVKVAKTLQSMEACSKIEI